MSIENEMLTRRSFIGRTAAYAGSLIVGFHIPTVFAASTMSQLPSENMHTHLMNVWRGPDDHDAVAMKCATCHGTENNPNSGVPGAPNWGLAPESMGWVGLNARELCQAIKDPKKNHGKTLEQLIHHNGEDKLVSWAWNPGPGREPAPGTQEFGENTRKWIEAGAACPQ